MKVVCLMAMMACILASLPGCETSTAEQPAVEPFIRGTITAIEGSTVRVEENPAEEFRGKKALLRITPGTIIVNDYGDIVSQADLAVGQFVSAWVAGPVLESYPVQARASLIVIEPAVVPL